MSVTELWLPILLAGVATHIASTIAWTVLPHHKPEWKGLGDDEDGLQDWIAGREIPAGQYLFPFASGMKEADCDAIKEKQQKCRGMLLLYQRPVNMGAAIGKTLAFFLVAAFMIGYLAAFSVPSGASFWHVFRFVSTAGILTHCFARFPHVFWFPEKIAMSLLDGVVYSLITAGVFAALWPS